MTNEEILAREFELIRLDLIVRHRELGMRASGQWARSVQVVSDRLSVRLEGVAYTQQLVGGRAPGRFPPISAIEWWIEDKGLTPLEGSLTVSSLAFLIARRIANEGTRYFQRGGTDLVESVITPTRIQRVIDMVSEFNVSEFVTEITGTLQELAA